jgi:hypothetical protein
MESEINTNTNIQLRISSFPFSMRKHKGEKKKLILPAVLFRYEMWSFKVKEEYKWRV